MSNSIKFATLADLIGIDPAKTYMGGGYKREDIHIHDIEIKNKTIRALCDVKNDYSDTRFFHFTQPAAYSCSAQLCICLYSFTKNIVRHQKGFHIFLLRYSTKWNRVIKTCRNIPVEVKMASVVSVKNKRSEEVKFKVNIDNKSFVSSYTAVFRLPGRSKK